VENWGQVLKNFSRCVIPLPWPGHFKENIKVQFTSSRQGVLRYNCFCHAYCLMDSYYHLLLETPDPNLSLGMHVQK